MIRLLTFGILFFSLKSFGFGPTTDSIQSIVDSLSSDFKTAIKPILNGASKILITPQSIILANDQTTSKCFEQPIQMITQTSGHRVQQIFAFKGCDEILRTYQITRVGSQAQALTLQQFLDGQWGYNDQLEQWSLLIPFLNISVRSQQSNHQIFSTIIQGPLQNSSPALESSLLISEENFVQQQTNVKRTSFRLKWKNRNFFFRTQITKSNNLFFPKYEFFEGRNRTSPEDFNSFYADAITVSFLSDLKEKLKVIPLEVPGPFSIESRLANINKLTR